MKNRWEDRRDHICIFINRKGEDKECLIDKEDFDKAAAIAGTWSCVFSCSNFYARHSWWEAGKIKYINMHHLIVGKPPKGRITDHENRNSLDNRRKNLRHTTVKMNVHNRRYDRKGFTIRFKNGRWEANSTIRPERKYIGRFVTKLDAVTGVLDYTRQANEGRPTFTEDVYAKVKKEMLEWATVVVP